MSLAYDYQIAIDAAETLCNKLAILAECDHELWPSAAYLMRSAAFRLDEIRPMLESRRNRISPDAADGEIARREGA